MVLSWDKYAIQGFYDYLLTESTIWGEHSVHYGYVPNASGGFYGMSFSKWRTHNIYDAEFDTYLQLECKKGQPLNICLKIVAPPQFNPSRLRNSLIWADNGKIILEELGFSKPSRYGSGRNMTIGIWENAIEDPANAENTIQKALENYDKYDEYLLQLEC